ncbi:MAG: endolytic transglycosylase MltG [Armatimonadota bacterium]|nr:endolytic transglycosylase MltG [Armatimonadota bacterium]MDR7437846.1 endolytic transglycosylase MltG [Armatimonadota bacterium]MDR7472106.1 endolytic transglycosylase MltG [Armatimonadota bacterium]MDR7507452.1 endolytic transglycosylase MltG [Armatimonadota bacterium]MDR7508780.1 endolytic transglycosylase MltG [Armatimonadota bacterium]
MTSARRTAVLAGAVLAAGAAAVASAATAVRPANPSGSPQVVLVPPGAPAAEIGRRLESEGIIRRASDFVWVVRLRRLEGRLQGGEYRLSPAMGLLEVVDVLARGQVLLHEVTVPEGYTALDVARLLADAGLGDRRRLEALVRGGAARLPHAFLRGVPTGSLEGYLFPDTYRLPRGWPEERVVGVLLDRFADVVLPLWRQEGGGRSLHEIVTMASLVEREARRDDERALIAGVLYNRLRRGMRLEVDATVLYALGRHKAVVTYRDLDVDSPYNTYRRAGLPPGPIANPGLASIRAALRPAATDYLYYVARPDGSHVFSRTYREHLAAIRRHRSGQ